MSLPEIDREFVVLPTDYTSPLTKGRYVRDGYTARCTTQLIEKHNMTYAEAVSLLPAGYRMSVLDEIAYLMQAESELKAKGENPRHTLQDPLFARQIKSQSSYPITWTHVALRAPSGKDTFPIDVINGKHYGRGDYLIGDKIIAEGIRIPISRGGNVVAIDPVLFVPTEVSGGNEPQHTMHWYFYPGLNEKKEITVMLLGCCLHDSELDRCLSLHAFGKRTTVMRNTSFRMFQGSLDDVPLPRAA